LGSGFERQRSIAKRGTRDNESEAHGERSQHLVLFVKRRAVFVSGPGEKGERPEKWGELLEEFRDGTSAADGTSPALPERGQDSRPRRRQHLEMLREL
jgi:hypothetical protein